MQRTINLPWYHLLLDAEHPSLFRYKYIPYPCNGGTRAAYLYLPVQHASRKPIPHMAPHRALTYPRLSGTSPIYVLFLLNDFTYLFFIEEVQKVR